MTARIGFKTTFDAAHRLHKHEGKCFNLHGHTYNVEVVFSGPVNENGMVLDFADLKQKTEIALAAWDHSLILDSHDPLSGVLLDNEIPLNVVLMDDEPTVENMILLIQKDIRFQFADVSIELVSIKVFETPNCWAELQEEY